MIPRTDIASNLRRQRQKRYFNFHFTEDQERAKRPKSKADLQHKYPELLTRFFFVVCFFIFGLTLIGLSYGIYFAKDAYDDLRSQKLEVYNRVEEHWNETYLE